MKKSQAIDAIEQNSRIVYTLALLTGIICIIGFSLDIFAISLGANFSSIEWRMGFVQQLGERCIIFLFGASLLCYTLQVSTIRQKHRIAQIYCILGLCICLGCFFYWQDSFRFRNLATGNLDTQSQSLEKQIQELSPQSMAHSSLAARQEHKEYAIEILQKNTEKLAQRATTGLYKTVIRTSVSLLIVGFGLVVMGLITLQSKQVLDVKHFS